MGTAIRTVTVTVEVSSPTFNAALMTALDTANTTTMNAILTTPPAGFQQGSIRIQPGNPVLIFDATKYCLIQQFTYQVNS